MRLRLQEEGEISYRGSQYSDLSLQGTNCLGEGGGQQWRRTCLGEGSQAALMQAGQHLQVLAVHPFFAAIVGMAL
jgi:hypothetical protein